MHFANAFICGKKPPFRGVFKYKDERGEWRQTVRMLRALNIYANADANAKRATAATINEVMERELSPQEMGSLIG